MVIQESDGYSCKTGTMNWTQPFQWARSNMSMISLRIRITPAAKSNSYRNTSRQPLLMIYKQCGNSVKPLNKGHL